MLHWDQTANNAFGNMGIANDFMTFFGDGMDFDPVKAPVAQKIGHSFPLLCNV